MDNATEIKLSNIDVSDLDTNELNCAALDDPAILNARKAVWEKEVADNGGVHPLCGEVDTRLLNRAIT